MIYFCILSQDLSVLEFGNADVLFRAETPFFLYWMDRPLSVENMLTKNVTANAEEIRIDFADFRFAARFPGNSYCRPAPKYTPDFKFTVTLKLRDEELIVWVSEVENIGCNSLKIAIAQNFFTFSTNELASLIYPIDFGARINFPRHDTYSNTFIPSAPWSLPVHGLFKMSGGIGFWCDNPDREYNVAFNVDWEGTAKTECLHLYDSMNNAPREMRFILFRAGEGFPGSRPSLPCFASGVGTF